MKKRVVKLKAKQPKPLMCRVSTIDEAGYYIHLYCPAGVGEFDWLRACTDVTLVPGHYQAIEKA
jgi:hypothetical protein